MLEDEDLFDQVYQAWYSGVGSSDNVLEADSPESGREGVLDLYVRVGIGVNDRTLVGTDVKDSVAIFVTSVSALMADLNRAYHTAVDEREAMEIERDNAVAGLFEEVAKLPTH